MTDTPFQVEKPVSRTGLTVAVFAVLFIAVGFIHAPMLGNGFLADDHTHIAVYRVNGFSWGTAWSPIGGHIKPLFRSFLWLQYKAFGSEARGYYLVNLVLHLLNMALIYRLYLRLFQRRAGAVICAALFGVFAKASFTVAWITTSGQLLAAAFMLAAALNTLAFIRTGRKRALASAAVYHLLMLFSFTSGLVLPFIMIGLGLILVNAAQRRRVAWLGLLLVNLIIYFAVRMVVLADQPSGAEGDLVFPGSLVTSVANMVQAAYGNLVPPVTGSLAFQYLPESLRGGHKGYLVILAVLLLGFQRWEVTRRREVWAVIVLFGLWALAAYLPPALGRVHLGAAWFVKQHRYLYMPSIPAIIGFVAVVMHTRPFVPRSRLLASILLGVFFGAVCLVNVVAVRQSHALRTVSAGYQKQSIADYLAEVERVLEQHQAIRIWNRPLHLRRSQNNLAMGWTVRPIWLTELYGNPEWAERVRFVHPGEPPEPADPAPLYYVEHGTGLLKEGLPADEHP